MKNNEKIEERYKICEKYGEFFNSFVKQENDNLGNYNYGDISKEMYHQIYKIHYYAGKYSDKNNRAVNHSCSGIFQDLIAYYLKVFLDDKYNVFLEYKEDKLQPDILIKKNNKYHFIIEVKTNIGWARNAVKDGTFKNRLKGLSKVFKIKQENIIFIFESPGNVSKEFLELYWDNESKQQKRPKKRIYRQIYPLFNFTDPNYMDTVKEFNLNKEEIYNDKNNNVVVNDKKIEELATKSIVTNFEDIIKLIEKE